MCQPASQYAYYLVFLIFIPNVEWHVANQHFICQDSDPPNIVPSIVPISFYIFRGEIQQCSYFRGAVVLGVVDCPSEVAQFGDALGHQNIFWFYVSMGDVVVVQIVQST